MSKREIRLLAVMCTFIGIVIGFILAPIKKGQTFYFENSNSGNNSGNNNSAEIQKRARKSRKENQSDWEKTNAYFGD